MFVKRKGEFIIKKKTLLIAAALLLLVAAAGIAVSLQKTTGNDPYADSLDTEENDPYADNPDMVTLEEARSDADVMMEKGRNGEYRNLIFQDFTPVITEEDQISPLIIKSLPPRDIDTQLKVLEAFYGDELDLDYVYEGNVGGDDLETARKKEKQGEYEERGFLLTYHKDEYHAQVFANHDAQWIDLGYVGIEPYDYLDQTYYVGAADGSLADAYLTRTGEMPVKEAIEQIETYLNEELPVPDKDKGNLDTRVFEVALEELEDEDGVYGFAAATAREYKGVPFESTGMRNGFTTSSVTDSIELTRAFLEGDDRITYFNWLSDAEAEATDTYKKILSPERALANVSEEIGEASQYDVWGVELMYKVRESTDENGKVQKEASPKWMVLATNRTDGRETRFFVDVITGEVTSRIL